MKTTAKILITLLLLGFLLFQLDWKSMREILVETDLTILSLCFFLFCSRAFLAAFRWKALLRAKGYTTPIMKLTKYYFVGIFFNFFFPTVVGGDLARGYYLHSHGVSKKVTVSSIIVERVLGVFSLVFLSCLSLAASFRFLYDTAISTVIGMAAVLLGITFILLFYSRTENLISRIIPKTFFRTAELAIKLLQDIREYKKTPQVLTYGLLISLLFQVVGVYATYLIGVSLGSTTEIVYYLTLVPIVWLISMLPVSLNGLGVREGAFVYLFACVGMKNEMAIAISLIFLLLVIAQGVIGSVLFVLDKREIANIKDAGF